MDGYSYWQDDRENNRNSRKGYRSNNKIKTMNILMCKLISGMAVVCETLVVQLTGRRVVGDVYV